MLTTFLTNFISFAAEIIIAGVLLLNKRLDFRFKPFISIPVGLIIAFGTAVGVAFWADYYTTNIKWDEFINIITYVVAYLGVLAAFFFAYKKSLKSVILTLSIAYTFQSISYQCTSLILDTGLQGHLFQTYGQDWYLTYYRIISKVIEYTTKAIVYVICYFLIARPYRKYSKYILKTAIVVLFGALTVLITNVDNTFVVHHTWWDQTFMMVMRFTLIILSVLFDFLIVGTVKNVMHTQEKTVIKATLNSKAREKEVVEKNINFINMKCHDLRKELRRLKSRKDALKDEDFALLEESLNFYDSSVNTGNVDIDALIQDKLIYCKSAGIEFTSLVDGGAFEVMLPSDVYFMLSNILDNAIEAVEQVEKKENRIVSFTASKKQGVLVVEQSNYFKGKIELNSDGSIKTTKDNPRYHGYGSKSINYIVKKYDGKMSIETIDNIFKLKIVI